MRRRALLASAATGLATAAGCTAPSGDRSEHYPPDSLPELTGDVPTVWRHDPPASPPALLHPATSVFSTDDTELAFTLESRSSTPTVISQFGTIELYRFGAERWHRIPRVIHPACGTIAVEDEEQLSVTVGTFGPIDENDGVGTGRFACSVLGSAPADAGGCGPDTDSDTARRFAATFRRE